MGIPVDRFNRVQEIADEWEEKLGFSASIAFYDGIEHGSELKKYLEEERMENKKAIEEIASACADVFEITGRSVPSNHQAKINSLAKKMAAIAEQFKQQQVEEKKEAPDAEQL